MAVVDTERLIFKREELEYVTSVHGNAAESNGKTNYSNGDSQSNLCLLLLAL